jgi:hypothetical protein
VFVICDTETEQGAKKVIATTIICFYFGSQSAGPFGKLHVALLSVEFQGPLGQQVIISNKSPQAMD